MLGTLIESRAARTRRSGGTLVSIALHTGMVGLAVTLTAHAGRRPAAPRAPVIDVVYRAPASRPASAPPPRSAPPVAAPAAPAMPDIPLPAAPIVVPSALPPIDQTRATLIPNWPDAASGPPVYRFPERWTAPGSGSGSGPTDGAWDANAVDRAVVPRAGNPAPAYPSMLRSAHVEGSVVVQFIVDTTGRAEPGSIHVLSSTHEMFTDAVRAAILASRYVPAEAHGERVRQVVEQRFTFALER